MTTRLHVVRGDDCYIFHTNDVGATYYFNFLFYLRMRQTPHGRRYRRISLGAVVMTSFVLWQCNGTKSATVSWLTRWLHRRTPSQVDKKPYRTRMVSNTMCQPAIGRERVTDGRLLILPFAPKRKTTTLFKPDKSPSITWVRFGRSPR